MTKVNLSRIIFNKKTMIYYILIPALLVIVSNIAYMRFWSFIFQNIYIWTSWIWTFVHEQWHWITTTLMLGKYETMRMFFTSVWANKHSSYGYCRFSGWIFKFPIYYAWNFFPFLILAIWSYLVAIGRADLFFWIFWVLFTIYSIKWEILIDKIVGFWVSIVSFLIFTNSAWKYEWSKQYFWFLLNYESQLLIEVVALIILGLILGYSIVSVKEFFFWKNYVKPENSDEGVIQREYWLPMKLTQLSWFVFGLIATILSYNFLIGYTGFKSVDEKLKQLNEKIKFERVYKISEKDFKEIKKN